MPLLKRRTVFAAKIESTIGTAETLTATEGSFNAYDVMVQANVSVADREGQGSFDYLQGVPGAYEGTVTFKTGMGFDTAVPSWATVLFPACGYVQSGTVFKPESRSPTDPAASTKTVTIGAFIDGVYKKLAGAMGNFKISAPAGQEATIEWEFKGVWQDMVDATIIAPTYPTSLPIRFGEGVITYNSINQVVENVSFDAGNEVILRESAATAAGFVSALVVSRQPRVTINPEAVLIATDSEDKYSYWTKMETAGGVANLYPFSCQMVSPFGAAATGTLVLAAPAGQIISIAQADRSKLVIDEIEIACQKNGGAIDEDVSITFTAG